MKQRVRLSAAVLVVGIIAGVVHADEPTIRKVLTAKLPDAKVLSVQKLPYAGLYEVAVQRPDGPHVYYTDESARIVLVGGNLIEVATDRSLTEERLHKLTAINWNTLPFQSAVTTRRGDGRREIAIFSDPNCPYCKKLEKDLATLDNITVHIFMYPVIKPESVRQTQSVWCSKDRAKAWNDLMLKDVQPTAPNDCQNPIDELVALGKKLGAVSTPTWFLRNGEKYQGALPMSTVVPLLDANTRRR
jgi:thiol:disulfide interchange protein DsbC